MVNQVPIQTPSQISSSPSVSSTDINLLMSENKLHHNELKGDLSRLLDKLDMIQVKMVAIETNNNQLTSPGSNMEASILMHNITRIVKVSAATHWLLT